MLQDKERVIIGYDLRVISNGKRYSIDPYVWSSLRVIDLESYLLAFEIGSVWDLSNGINLMIDLPNHIPNNCVLAAFDAPSAIVNYMSKSFGLTASFRKKSGDILSQHFKFLGFDIADLWTQTSALNNNVDLYEDSDMKLFENDRNQNGLIENETIAWKCCRIADKLLPYAPYQPVGIWIFESSN